MPKEPRKTPKDKTLIIERDDDIEEDEFEEGAAAEALEQDLAAVLDALGAEIGTDILLKIYRKDAKTNKREWVTDARPENLPLEPMIQAEFGGGAYEIDVYGPTPGGSKSRKKTIPLPIAQRRELPAVAAAGAPLDIDKLFTKMAEQQSNTLKQVTELLTLKMENMVLKSGGGQQGLGVKDLLEMFSLFKELSPQSKASSPIEMFKEMAALKDLMPDLFGSGNGMTGWDAMLKGVQTLADAAKATAGNAAARLPAPGAAAVHADPPAGDVESFDEGENVDMFAMVLRGKLTDLCERAADDRNPGVYAQVALDEIPDAYYPKLVEFLGADDLKAVDKLVAICPQVAQFRPWFVEFCAEIRAELEPDADPQNLTTAVPAAITAVTDPNSSAPNAANNAADGAGNPSNTTIDP